MLDNLGIRNFVLILVALSARAILFNKKWKDNWHCNINAAKKRENVQAC